MYNKTNNKRCCQVQKLVVVRLPILHRSSQNEVVNFVLMWPKAVVPVNFSFK